MVKQVVLAYTHTLTHDKRNAKIYFPLGDVKLQPTGNTYGDHQHHYQHLVRGFIKLLNKLENCKTKKKINQQQL